MKVGYLTDDFSLANGWGRVSVETVRGASSRGVEALVLCPAGRAGSSLLGVALRGVLIPERKRWIPTRPAAALNRLWAVRLLRGCDAVHCLTEPLFPLGAWISRALDIPLFLTLHGTYSVSLLKGPAGAATLDAYGQASAMIANSAYTARRVGAEIPQHAGKIRPVPLGIEVNSDASLIRPAARRERAFLMVGGVKPRKGIMETVEALAEVRKVHPDVRLYVVGSMPMPKYLVQVREKITSLGLADAVILTGHVTREELRELYARVRGHVMPSQNVGDHFEGFGLVHLEANEFGVPSIGTRDCGNEDAIAHGQSGFLVGQADREGLVEAMLKLLDPAFDWDAFSLSARRFAESMAWSRFAEAHLEIYRAHGMVGGLLEPAGVTRA